MSRIRVKICGVTTVEDIHAAADAGADAVGLNFFQGSRRFVDPRAAGPLIRRVPPFMDTVGVFVDTPVRQMCAVAYQLGLRSIQWIGTGPRPNEDTFPFPLIAACRLRDHSDLSTHLKLIREYVALRQSSGHPLGAILIDSYVPGEFGGTGQTAPWEKLAGFDPGAPLILAGGLTPDNVAEAIRVVRPYGVDVASGVESSPGRKDLEKLRRFVNAVRES